jgi:hypothetical protein
MPCTVVYVPEADGISVLEIKERMRSPSISLASIVVTLSEADGVGILEIKERMRSTRISTVVIN